MKSAQYETEMKLPPIRVTNQSTIRSMADSMLGHRQDENCNLNRAALMIEKANRLGEGAKQATSPTNGQTSPRGGEGPMISQQLKRELYKRKNSPGEIARNAALVSASLQPEQQKKLQIFDSYDMAIGKPRKNMA